MKTLNASEWIYFNPWLDRINSKRQIPPGSGHCYRDFYHDLLYLPLKPPWTASETLPAAWSCFCPHFVI